MMNLPNLQTFISHAATSARPGKKLVRRGPSPMVLEQRFMFDGAAVADATHTLDAAVLYTLVDKAISTAPSALVTAQAEAQRLVTTFLTQPDARAQLFALFNGGQSTATPEWQAAFDQLMASLTSGDGAVKVELRTSAELQGAKGAFTSSGTDGKATIYLNADWLNAGADSASITAVLLEELGHSLDARLNNGADTPGDEGERFSRVLLGGIDPYTQYATSSQDDRGVLQLDGQTVNVEFASYAFVNAYEMVYDLNASGAVQGNLGESDAAKEQSGINFNPNISLGRVTIDDGIGSQAFSGNDVSATAIVLNGATYYGWISRPIKSNGTVRGFYFWTDTNFTSLASAQANGNADADNNTADNRGFVLVVDQTWFDGQISSTRSTALSTGTDINGLALPASYATVGSSSDRVDLGLNSLLTPNAAPTPANDVKTVLEDSGANTGNVLSNDTDPNLDPLTVTSFTVNGNGYSAGTIQVISGVGSITLNTDGSYTFTPVANYAGAVPAIPYAVSDGSLTATSTLSISMTPVNDAPAGADKTITARAALPYTFTPFDFGFTDPNDTPANTLLSVKITTLPTLGTLTLDGSPVSLGAFIVAADISKLQYTSPSGASGSTYATFTFQVRDNGGTANSGVDLDASANTITVSISNINRAPTAVADTVSAVEAGGVGNGTAGTSPSGNVLTNDTDPDSSDTKTVIEVTGVTSGTVAGPTGGLYGSLTLNADGSYSYAVDNNNSAVQALRLSTNTLTDTFTYTVRDTAGLTSTTTLTVTIQGANDAPVAKPDFGSATISTTVANETTGNVLSNDTDVDQNSETKAIVGLEATGQYVSFAAGGTSTSLSFASDKGSFYTKISIGDYAYTSNIAPGSNNYWHLKTAAGELITVTSKATNADGTFSIGLSGTVSHYSASTPYPLNNGTGVVFNTSHHTDGGNPSGGENEATITTSTSVTSSTVTVNSVSGNIVAGMTATGTNIPSGAKVTAVTTSGGNTVVTLDKDVTIAPSGTITFTAAAGSTVNGSKGSLQLNADGSYTYTTFVNTTGGTSGTDVFSYQMRDDNTNSPALKSSSTLTINVQMAAATVTAAADTITVTEDSAPGSPIGNLVSNDTISSGTKAVTGFTWNGVTGVLGTPLTVTGVGTLTIASNGDYTFTPAADYSGSVPVVGYTMTDGTSSSSSTLTLTITPANDAPVAVADTASATEAGGYSNATAGINPSGNVLSNDTDVDSGDTKTVSAIASGTVGSAKAGTYGNLTLNANGSYTYTVTDGNTTVQALNVGNTLTDTFTYTVRDTAGLTSSATLTVTIHGANDAPVNTLPTTPTIAEGVSGAITGISVADPEANISTVQLSVQNGNVTIANLNSATVSSGTNGTATLTLSGTLANINLALATLSYQGNANFSGTDYLSVTSTDAGGLTDVDTLTLTISPDNRLVSVTGTTVNEASPYVLFTVSGATGQQITLTLANGTAAVGLDFLASMEYYSTTWQSYAGAPIAMPGTTMLVRVAVLQDTLNEGSETLTLTATNKAGTASAAATSTIRDDAQGSIYLVSNTTGTADTSGTGYPSYLDDDRSVTVNSIVLNEASPRAVFTVSGAVNQVIRLELVDGSAKVDADGTPLTNGTEDYGPSLQIYVGSAWVNYTPGNDITLAGATLLVRTTLVNDTVFEGQEAFFLKVTKQSSGAITSGSANIYDDRTGSIYLDGNTTGTANISSDPGYPSLDDDRTISVNNLTINEASNYAVFTVTGNSGQTASLQLINESSSGTVAGKANVNTSQALQVWDGSAWTAYDTNNLPTFDANGKFYVRVDITAEQDIPFEGAETFKLNATLTGQTTAATGTGTIIDDGTGTKYDGTITSGTPGTNTTSLDDDRPLTLTVNSISVNEASPYAVFTVTGAIGQTIGLTLAAGSATGSGTDFGSATATANLQYSLDGGTTWVNYSTTPNPTLTGTTMLVRTPVIEDSIQDNGETLTLTATPVGGSAVVGTATINDQGGGTIFTAAGADNTSATKSDDRPVPTAPPPIAPPQIAPPPPAPVSTEVPLAPLPPFNSATVMQVQSPKPQIEIGTFPVEAILTSDTGFPVVVADPGNTTQPASLKLFNGVTDQFVEANSLTRFALPFDTFSHTKPDATIMLVAQQADGTPLPSWVQFDAQSGTFTVNPPPDFNGEMKLVVIARDQEGNEATAPFRFFVGEDKDKAKDKTKLSSRLGLTEQLQLAGKRQAPWADLTRQQADKLWTRAPVMPAAARVAAEV